MKKLMFSSVVVHDSFGLGRKNFQLKPENIGISDKSSCCFRHPSLSGVFIMKSKPSSRYVNLVSSIIFNLIGHDSKI